MKFAQPVSVGQYTDTWGQLVLLTTTLNHKTCINTSRQVLEKTLFAINAIFTQDNLSKTKVVGSQQKTNATCSKCKTNLILTYRHRSRRPTFVLERLFVIFSKRALIADSVFFKTLSNSIYTSNMIKGGGQGGLKRKNY